MAETPCGTDGGNFAPISVECDAPHLPVLGELPRGLDGTLFRNGPNPQFPPPAGAPTHWFAGDGMVHAFTLRNGRAAYRNRWVRTAKWRAEAAAGRALVPQILGMPPQGAFADEGVANTNVVWHAGRLLALEEAHAPIELDPATLATRGVQDCGDATLRGRPFTAHPKLDPATGELVFFGYGVGSRLTPGMAYGVLAPDGRVARYERFEAPYSAMVHDFAVTGRHVLVPVLPLTGSLARAQAGAPPYAWEPELGGHVGLIARDAGVASLRWFRAPACFVFHVLNAWDEPDGRVCADVMRYEEPPLFPRADGRAERSGDRRARLVRWTLDPARSDAIAQAPLDDTPGEFPRLDERFAGRRNRHGVFAGESRAGAGLDSLVWLDLARGTRSVHTLPAGDALSEPVFVPRRPDAAEGDGWLLAVAWRGEERRSDLLVFDTQGVDRGPVAAVQLSHRVPFGFHGNWVPAGAA